MNTTDYVSYPLALALKEAGFDEPCIAKWAVEPDGKPALLGTTTFVFENSECADRDACAPLLWQAQKWLRERKGVDIELRVWLVGVKREYRPYIMLPKRKDFIAYPPKKPYEKALSSGIAAALELIEKEGV